MKYLFFKNNKPNGTRNIAAVNKNEVGTQLNTTAFMENSFPITGSAMFTDEPTKGKRKEANVATNRADLLVTVSLTFIHTCQ